MTVRVRFLRVRPEKLERLRWWMEEVARRRDEALETLANESLSFPIDHDHRRVMYEVLMEPFPSEPLLDLRA